MISMISGNWNSEFTRPEFMVSHQSCEFSLAEAPGPNMKFTSSFFSENHLKWNHRGPIKIFAPETKPVDVNRGQCSKSRHREEIIQIAMDQNHATLCFFTSK